MLMQVFQSVFTAITVLVSLLTGLLALNRSGFVWELISHFRLIYLTTQLLFLIFIVFVGLRSRRFGSQLIGISLFVLLALLFNLKVMAPYYFPQLLNANSTVERPLTLLHMNVLGTNRDSARAIQLIQAIQPDILVLAEYNDRWQQSLKQAGVLKSFQGQFVVPYGNDGVYTRFPMRKPQVTFAKPGQDPIVHIGFLYEEKPVQLVVLHPRPPVKPLWYQRHRAHFSRLEREVGNEHTPLIVVGDLNTSPWSVTFQHFLKNSGLQDSQRGFGIQPSWPTYIPKLNMPFRLFNVAMPVTVIPIDHVLMSPDWNVLERKTGPDIGSDHLPVIVQLGLKEKR